MTPLSPAQLAEIQQFDTCSVLNAIETFKVRLRNEGYAKPGLRWLFPAIGSVIGYAATLRVKGSNPPVRGARFEDKTEWWSAIEALPSQRIAVVQDAGEESGIGAVAGEVHASILQRLGCMGLVTDGSIRDLNAIETMGFACSAASVSPSHAYAHTVDHSRPVAIFGLTIRPGDLLMADRHGVISIPVELATEIPAAAARMRDDERRIIDFCRGPAFSLEQLKAEVG
jgi:4-hydroxy-4-methyl-2-oxoglutarate aldolase